MTQPSLTSATLLPSEEANGPGEGQMPAVASSPLEPVFLTSRARERLRLINRVLETAPASTNAPTEEQSPR